MITPDFKICTFLALKQGSMHQPNLPSDKIILCSGVTIASQLRTLRRLFNHIRSAKESHNPPVVEVDLDLTATMPIHRTSHALSLTGKKCGIDFNRCASLLLLPGYSNEAWMSFVKLCGLEKKYPKFKWSDGCAQPNKDSDQPFAIFHNAYWTTELIAEDTPTRGLGAFVHRVNDIGAEVVFISGRWLHEHVAPTIYTLQRAGIQYPKLVIGNKYHPTLVPPDQALSDDQIKVRHQTEVMKFGRPVAIIDDRESNRAEILRNNPELIGIAVSVPGFTYDPIMNLADLRISTFETFDNVIGDSPRRSYMDNRYRHVVVSIPWNGLYEGLGRNKLSYVLPRIVRNTEAAWSGIEKPFQDLVDGIEPGTLSEEDFIEVCGKTIPDQEIRKLDRRIAEAKNLAHMGMSAELPITMVAEKRLRLSLLSCWLHSRDIEQLMTGIGYPLQAAGFHDLEEYVDVLEVRRHIKGNLESGSSYSEWFLRWSDSLPNDGTTNIGYLNPYLLVGMWLWRPRAAKEDAMDVHRLSSHHLGDKSERYDPIEAAVNNLLHQREGTLGIRKEAVVGWKQLRDSITLDTAAERFAGGSSLSGKVLRDAIKAAIELEKAGALTPWALVRGASFED